MSISEFCTYRNVKRGGQGRPIINIGQPPPEQGPVTCQILIEKGVADTTCYNPELNQKSCPISPLSSTTTSQ